MKILLFTISFFFLMSAYADQGLESDQTTILSIEKTISPLPNFRNPTERRSEAEKSQGRNFFSAVQKNAPVIIDFTIQQYLTNLGHLLLNHASTHNSDYTFFLINTPAINAFAGPDGHIGINLGIIQTASHEGEVAYVLAHEIAHIKQEHLLRISEQENYSSIGNPMLTLALLLGGLTLGNSKVALASVLLTQGKYIEDRLSFSQIYEQEADFIGLKILNASGFASRYAVSFTDKVLSKEYKNQAGPLLSTHPLTRERISYLKNLSTGSDFKAPHSEFTLIQARLATITGYKPHRLSAEQLFYMNFYEHIRKNKNKQALTLWNNNPSFHLSFHNQLLYLELLIDDQQHQAAWDQLTELKKHHPYHLQLIHLESTLLRRTLETKKAEKVLKDGLAWHNNHKISLSMIWQLLADLYQEQENQVLTNVALAWKSYYLGHLQKALNLLNIAIRTAEQQNLEQHLVDKLKITHQHWHQLKFGTKSNLN